MSRELDRLRDSMIAEAQQDSPQFPVPLGNTNSFFSFRYSRTEISSYGGSLNLKMKETRYQNGKLVSEECEGTLDPNAYDAMIRETQSQFLNQIGNFIRLFYLPFSGRDRR